jgi:hypothetical protein
MDGKRDDDNDGDAEKLTGNSSHSLSDVTKMPPRMASVDDSVMLDESYEPQEEDVICSWARQNHGHRKYIDWVSVAPILVLCLTIIVLPIQILLFYMLLYLSTKKCSW